MNIENPPAFPVVSRMIPSKDEFPIMSAECEPGLTMRDYFAAKAMQGQVFDPNCFVTSQEIAKASYRIADAMLAARQTKDQ